MRGLIKRNADVHCVWGRLGGKFQENIKTFYFVEVDDSHRVIGIGGVNLLQK